MKSHPEEEEEREIETARERWLKLVQESDGTVSRNEFPLGHWPAHQLPTCQKCLKRVFHEWQAGWIYRTPGKVCECERPAMFAGQMSLGI